MEYYAKFSIIDERHGFMGVEDETFEADDMEELKECFKEHYDTHDTKIITHFLDELEDEEGNEIDREPFLVIEG